MLEVVLSNRFKKDLKLAVRRGLPLDELNTVVDWLAAGQALPDRNRDHALTGDYIGFRECHIRPDWLLVYRVDGDALELFEIGDDQRAALSFDAVGVAKRHDRVRDGIHMHPKHFG